MAAQYTFKLTTTTDIEEVIAEKASMNIFVRNNTLYIGGVEVENLAIFGISGAMVANEIGVDQYDLSGLNKGVYIVRVVDVNGDVHVAKFAK